MSHQHDAAVASSATSSLLLSSINNTAASNLTSSSFLSTCSVEHFLVPLFDTADSAHNLFTRRNQEAHLVLGFCLCTLVATWSLWLLEWIGLKRAFTASALIQITMGFYLIVSLQLSDTAREGKAAADADADAVRCSVCAAVVAVHLHASV